MPRVSRAWPLPSSLFAFVVLLAGLAAGPAPAGAAAGWDTWLYTGYFTDMIATPNEVWCATREGGLLRWDRTTRAYEAIRREPGGILSNELTSLVFDREGRLWVGTADAGVARLRSDRSAWEAVNQFDGLPSDSVTKLLVVGDTIWVGTKAGIALWNGHIITGSLPDGNTVSFDTTFKSAVVTGIVQLADSLYLATKSGIGMAHVSTGLQDWRPVNSGIDPNYLPILDLVSDGKDMLTVGTDYTYRYDFATRTWQFAKSDGLMLSRGQGGILLGASSGVFRWDGSAFQPLADTPLPIRKPSDQYRDFMRATEDPSGTVFAGTADVLYEQPASGAWIAHRFPDPPDNSILSVAAEGTKVYVTSFGGVGRFDGADWKQWRAGIRCRLPGCSPDTSFLVAAFPLGLLAQSNGTKWVGDWSSAVETFTDAGPIPSFVHKFVPSSSSDLFSYKQTWIYAAAEGLQGGVWFGLDTPVADDPSLSPLGLAQYDANGNLLKNFTTSNSTLSGTFVRAIAPDRLGTLWVGYFGEGVDHILPPSDPSQKADSAGFRHLSDTDGLLVKGIATYGDSLWVLSTVGLRRYTIRASGGDRAQQVISVPGGQDQFALRPLAVAADGSVWSASGDGLWHFLVGGGFQHFDHNNSPLASDVIRDVVVDPLDGRVWVGTAAGLHRFDPDYVAPPPPAVDALHVQVWPNPSFLTLLGPAVSLAGDVPAFEVTIYDLGGRRVRHFDHVATGAPFWDGRDEHGGLVRPGVFFLKASFGGRSAVTRLVMLH